MGCGTLDVCAPVCACVFDQLTGPFEHKDKALAAACQNLGDMAEEGSRARWRH